MFNEILKAYKNFWLEALEFEGTTNRKDWWWVQLANLLISFITIPIFARTFGFNIYGLLCLVPQLAIDLRRIRDYGKDWKWIFINLIPILGWFIWFIWLGFGKTGSGKNRFL